ncbi:hypothetical protein D1007_45828 [Hordeum vulgare]|nr:hypothetical protein D1007_45828 [Hordeum vulgare]
MLSPAEQQEHRHQGLCFNCDEPYTPTHVCPRLFYLETVDYIEADETNDAPDPAADSTATACVVSLHALADIRHERTMLLPVTIHGEQLIHSSYSFLISFCLFLLFLLLLLLFILLLLLLLH